MVITKGPLFSARASGAFKKSLTFRQQRGRSIVSHYAVPEDKRTSVQSRMREAFEVTYSMWSGLSSSRKQELKEKAAARGLKMTGYNYFMHKYINRYSAVEDLAGLWLFYEGEGSTVHDVSGEENHGALVGSTNWENTAAGKALRFHGGTERVALPDVSNLPVLTGAVEATIACWVNLEDIIKLTALFGIHNPTGQRLIGSVSDGFWDMGIGANAWGSGHTGTLRAASTGWTFLVIVFSGGSAVLYIDTEETITKPYESINIEGVFPVGNFNNRNIYYSNAVDGLIDSFAIYSRPLSVAEIQHLFNLNALVFGRTPV